jgi:hypothetical protein
MLCNDAVVGGNKQRANNANANEVDEQSKEESHPTNQGRSHSKRSKSRKDKIFILNVSYHNNASKHDFLLDSGASCHMSCDSSWLHNLHPIPSREIRLADNSVIHADEARDLVLEAPSHRNTALKLTMKDVLYVSKLGLNLLSRSRLAEKGVTSVFDKHGCALIDNLNHNDTLARASLRDNLYWISDMVVTPVPENATPVASENMSEEVEVWHNRLAHVNRQKSRT